ncbi:MAG: excinuclease ABC subunit UvrC [Termitinemataceae bacterium]|nr:MAG: excinuclease ABC subunit UvrC [Termitinemataceae bacterium]
MREDLRNIALDAPQNAGCYLWRDSENKIIYIGKAKNLRKRLLSYFSNVRDPKTITLLKNAFSIETIIVQNEYEALLLENTLIKQHSPKYNISLKDGKTYPVIRITSEKFPKVFRTRFVVNDGSLYFGPYPQVHTIDALLGIANKVFPIRKCKKLRKRSSPCLYYHIKRCSAPCCGKITPQKYAIYIKELADVFSGETEKALKSWTLKMHKAAIAQKYEEAGEYRDAIAAIENLSAQETVSGTDSSDRDYIAFCADGVLCTFSVFEMRGGRLSAQQLFRTRSASDDVESLCTFVINYYSLANIPPPVIYVSEDGIYSEELKRYFSETFGTTPVFSLPECKRDEAALSMAYLNAKEDIIKRLKLKDNSAALNELQEKLSLKRYPQRIEGFDIAQLEGRHPVASLISFKDGRPDKKNYRHFKLKTVIGKVDDFAAMREVISRRYSRLIENGSDMPDLLLIDGGIGQVNAVRGALQILGLEIEIIGLAKRNEEIWRPNAAQNPIVLPKTSEALKVLQAVRDETHRFATSLNQKLRSADINFSTLQSIDGIGVKAAAKIMKEFGSVEAIAATMPTQIAERLSWALPRAKLLRKACILACEDRAAETKRLEQANDSGVK